MSRRGPFLKQEDLSAFAGVGYSYPHYHRRRGWYTQDVASRRKGNPLPFNSEGGFCNASGYYTSNGWNNSDAWYAVTLSLPEEVREDGLLSNKLYDKFRDKVMGSTADLGASAGEWRQAVDMIATRATQMRRMYSSVKKGRFGDAYAYFVDGVYPRTVRRKLRDGGGMFLEYHLGWEPFINDIYDAVNACQEPVPVNRIKTSVRGNVSKFENLESFYNKGFRQRTTVLTRRAACNVEVENYNLHLADKLGLINPASVAWELVPLSFVIDWFVPVGDFLRSMTDFAGLHLSGPENGFYRKSESTIFSQDKPYPGYTFLHDQSEAFLSGRYDSLPASPTLTPKRVNGLSPMRGATAVSLLLQTLRGK